MLSMSFRIKRDNFAGLPSLEEDFPAAKDVYMDVETIDRRLRAEIAGYDYYGGSPGTSVHLGAGTIALYLGCEPEFRYETLWFTPFVEDNWANVPEIKFDPENHWFKWNLEATRRLRELAKGDYAVGIPDLLENLDVLSNMRGPQQLCYDLMDCPDIIHKRLQELDSVFFTYYNAFYDAAHNLEHIPPDERKRYRWEKVQCDFSAMISPEQYRKFVMPTMEFLTGIYDYSQYHLDGPDALRHVDAIVELPRLGQVQWSYGAGNPDALWEGWYEPLYDKVIKAGKSLDLKAEHGNIDDWIHGVGKLVNRYGAENLHFAFPEMSREDAERLIAKAERDWK